MTADNEIILCQLGRIFSAAQALRRQDSEPSKPVAWWEPGSVWSARDPSHGLDFAAFQIGVTAREIGGLPVLTAIVSALAEKSGGPAAQWLAEIWAELQPDWEARSQFLSSLGDHTQ